MDRKNAINTRQYFIGCDLQGAYPFINSNETSSPKVENLIQA
jgi:hypothetical protein